MRVLFDAAALAIQQAQRIGGFGVGELRRAAKIFGGLAEIGGDAIAFERQNAELQPGAGVVLRRRLFQQLAGAGKIARAALAGEF